MELERGRDEGRRREEDIVHIFLSVGIFISVGKPVQRKVSFDERYKKK